MHKLRFIQLQVKNMFHNVHQPKYVQGQLPDP